MSQWNGRHGKGYGRKVRELKREEAVARQAGTYERPDILAERERRIEAYQAGYSACIAGVPFTYEASRSWQNGWDAARRVRP